MPIQDFFITEQEQRAELEKHVRMAETDGWISDGSPIDYGPSGLHQQMYKKSILRFRGDRLVLIIDQLGKYYAERTQQRVLGATALAFMATTIAAICRSFIGGIAD